jgi:hypothetical protein
MAQKNREELKPSFESGAKPTGKDFSDFIDSTLNFESDGIKRPENDEPLQIEGGVKINGPLTVVNGPLTVEGAISGNIDADKIISGTLAVERIPNLSADKIISGTLAVERIPNLSADKIIAGTLNSARIPSLSASKITSGALAVDRIPSLPANKITSGTLAVARIPNLSASKITSGTINGNLTVSGEDVDFPGHMYLREHGSSGIAFIQAREDGSNSDISLQFRTQRRGRTKPDISEAITITSKGLVGIGTNEIETVDRGSGIDHRLTVNGYTALKGPLLLGNENNVFQGRQSSYVQMKVREDNDFIVSWSPKEGVARHIAWNGNGGWVEFSDFNLKRDIETELNILDRLMQIEVKNYRWKDDPINSLGIVGLIAQDILPLFPSLVRKSKLPGEDELMLTLEYSKFGVLAIGGLRELKREKDAEIAKIKSSMDDEIRSVKAQIQALSI